MKQLLILATASLLLFSCNSNKTESKDEKMVSGATDEKKTPAAVEIADAKYTEMGKKMSSQFESGDVDGWLANFADNAKYYWSGGDSLVGKQAITDYWKNRRGNVIKAIKFSNDIWLPVKVNTPQNAYDLPGVWLMSWYQVNATYKTDKSAQFWVHISYHFDANDKIDEVASYIDFVPINKALGK